MALALSIWAACSEPVCSPTRRAFGGNTAMGTPRLREYLRGITGGTTDEGLMEQREVGRYHISASVGRVKCLQPEVARPRIPVGRIGRRRAHGKRNARLWRH